MSSLMEQKLRLNRLINNGNYSFLREILVELKKRRDFQEACGQALRSHPQGENYV